MKKFRFFIFFSLIICCLFAWAGCKPELSRPTNLDIEQDTLTLTWDEVENARFYTISINGEENDARRNSYSLTKLAAGTYTIKVKACASDYSDSGWSESIPFEREAETGMVFKLINNGTEYEVTNIGTAKGDIIVPETYREKPVTSIGRKAFSKKSQLTSIVLSDNITNISEQAFYNCSYLKTANIPAGLKTLGAQAFQSCSLLEMDVVIPEAITEIPENAFAYCRAVKTITLHDKITSIGTGAFEACESVETVTVPDSVKTIGEYAFANCSKLASVTIGANVTSLGNYTFMNDYALTNVTIGEKVQTIGSGAFINCTSLASVDIPDSVEVLGVETFKGAIALADVELGSGITNIGGDSFVNTALWTAADNKVYVGNWLVDCKITDATSYKEECGRTGCTKRDDVCGVTHYDVAVGTIGIGGYAFVNCSKVQQIYLPDTVKILDYASFAGCVEMTNIVIGSGVETIEESAFESCVKLSKAILSGYDFEAQVATESSLKTIGRYAFYQCEKLASIEIPETVETVGAWAFQKSALYMNQPGPVYAGNWLVDYNANGGVVFVVNVKEGTVGISDYALYGNTYVSEVSIPNSVKTIGRAAFYQMGYLQKANLPEGLKKIEAYTFYGCTYLVDINIPDTVEYIGRSAFYECIFMGCEIVEVDGIGYLQDREGETVLNIPDSVQYIDAFAFYGVGYSELDPTSGETLLYGIDKIVIGDGVTAIGEKAFYNWPTLKALELGSALTEIGARAFYKCSALETITFGDALTTLGTRAFYGCTSLQELTLPDSLTEISDYAFYKCESLTSLTFGSGVTTIGNYAFSSCKSLTSLQLPATVTSVGKQAFRGGKALKSVIIADTVTSISDHAIYGCSQATFYVEAAAKPENWGDRWNSSYRPVVWGVTLSSDNDYVVSFVKTASSVSNVNALTVVNGPERAGYTFGGWTTVAGGTTAEYAANEISSVVDGTTLYAVWDPVAA